MLRRAAVAPALAIVVAALGGCNGSATSGGGASTDAGQARANGVKLVRVGRFSAPIYVTAPPGDTRRVFVVERAGRIRVMRDGRVLGRPFLDISADVRTDSERGLLSMAFAPGYARSGLFYVYYTDRTGDIHVKEFRRQSSDVAAAGSGRDVLVVGHRRHANHDGGQLQFGPDGFLYVGIGDGGSEGDPDRNGQNLGTDLAKLLRIDPRPARGRSFTVPAGNPFAGRAGARPEIWAYGLRNPWRFSFDRSTGDLTIADVGQDAQEEVDFQPRGDGRGANYGWSVFEGTRRYNRGSAPGAVGPVLTTTHSAGNCAITGGYVVRDRSLPALYGRYVYGDLCNPNVYSVKLSRGGASGRRPLGVAVGTLVSFGEDARGHVYLVSLKGPVYRLAPG